MPYTRALKYHFPLMYGEDVLELQLQLKKRGYVITGQADGIFGSMTESAVRAFQASHNLKVDGVAGPQTWTALFQDKERKAGIDKVLGFLPDLKRPHAYRDSVKWYLDHTGVIIETGPPETFGGEPKTVRRVWNDFRPAIEEWAQEFGVPVELIIATISTETRGDPAAVRKEPGYISDEHTPDKVSPGLMQTLISTARDVLGDDSIDRKWLLAPQNSIRAGTALIAQQWKVTHLDPPKVACAYNAGSLYYNNSKENRWKMRQYPVNTSEHADRFVKWFNECFIMFEKDGTTTAPSFFTLFNRIAGDEKV